MRSSVIFRDVNLPRVISSTSSIFSISRGPCRSNAALQVRVGFFPGVPRQFHALGKQALVVRSSWSRRPALTAEQMLSASGAVGENTDLIGEVFSSCNVRGFNGLWRSSSPLPCGRIFTSTIVLRCPAGSRASVADVAGFSPKIARRIFLPRHVVSPFGVTLPTRMSPAHVAPIRITRFHPGCGESSR